jgi:multimeric flavodoxin WrbA
MRAYLLSDGAFLTPRQAELSKLVCDFLAQRGFETEQKAIANNELAFCRGCFDCWVKTPGECAIKDGIAEINRACMASDVVIYLCPVVFGQFSANIKSAIDRWLPNMLPFFNTRKDGSTMHPPRYADYPKQIFIGYGETLTDKEAQVFIDITMKHRSNIEMIIDSHENEKIISALSAADLHRVGGSL